MIMCVVIVTAIIMSHEASRRPARGIQLRETGFQSVFELSIWENGPRNFELLKGMFRSG